jgi:hypothetical protein
MLYQVSLATHQEIEVQWDLLPGNDHPVRRDAVAERLLFLVSHPDGAKYRLEKVGALDLSSRKPIA